MFIAYILTKANFLRFKLIRLNNDGVFKHGNYEYKIDRKKIYQKKLFGLKLIFFSMYFEGNPDPIEFNEKGFKLEQSDIPLNDIAIILNKINSMKFTIYILIIVAINLLLLLVIASRVFEVA